MDGFKILGIEGADAASVDILNAEEKYKLLRARFPHIGRTEADLIGGRLWFDDLSAGVFREANDEELVAWRTLFPDFVCRQSLH
jgi:hypothetical protein